MSKSPRRPLLRWAFSGLLAVCLGYSVVGYAKTTGVDDDAALQTGPCYQTLVDRNVAQPTTAPNRELGAACATEHDDVERAWARVLRLWGSDSADVPDYDSYVRSDAGATASPAWAGLAMVGILLVYALCGTPMRSAARLMSGGASVLQCAGRAIASAALRGLLGLCLLWLLGFSYATAIGSLAFVALLARNLGASTTTRAADAAQEETGGFPAFAADVINDVAGAALGVLGLALLARHDPRLLAAAIALAFVASIPAVIFARRRLRAHPLATTISGALLSAAVGATALLDPPFAALTGGGAVPRLATALTLAIAVVAWGWRNLKIAPALAGSEGPGS